MPISDEQFNILQNRVANLELKQQGTSFQLQRPLDSISKNVIEEVAYNLKLAHFENAESSLTANFTLTPTRNYHRLTPTYKIYSDTSTAIADGEYEGQLLLLEGSSDTNTVLIRNNANTVLNSDCTLELDDTLLMIWDNSNWLELARQESGVTDHGALSGLADDDHTQYVLRTLLTNQGDIPYRDGSNWARLAPGTSGQFLKTQGAGANPTWSSVSGAWLTEYSTITTAPQTSFSITGLDLATDKAYMLVFDIVNGYAGTCYYYLEINGDTTATNYYSEFMEGAGASPGSGNSNTPEIAASIQNQQVIGQGIMMQPSGVTPRYVGNASLSQTTDLRIRGYGWAHTETTNVTSIQIVANQANGIGTGSVITLLSL